MAMLSPRSPISIMIDSVSSSVRTSPEIVIFADESAISALAFSIVTKSTD